MMFQCGDRLIVNKSVGGATIENVCETVQQVDDTKDSLLVIVTGTNNFKTESARLVIKKFEKLVEIIKKRRGRGIVAGIPKRFDLDRYAESRRIVVNMKVKAMCDKAKLEYVEFEPSKNQVLRDGLHLNTNGLHSFGSLIFKALVPFLCLSM